MTITSNQAACGAMPSAVIFDLDGTLVDSAPDIREALNAAFAPLGVPAFDLATAKKMIGGGAAVALRRAQKNAGLDESKVDQKALMDRFMAVYLDASKRGRGLFPGAHEMLSELRGRGVPLAICTNKAQEVTDVAVARSNAGTPRGAKAAVVGGAKVSTKIPVLTSMVAKVDKLIIGGGMANTFLQAQGKNVGTSLSEPDFKDTALEIIAAAKAANCEIVLPVDAVVAREFKAGASNEVVSVDGVPSDAMILDVGPKSVAHLSDVLAGCKTLLWNGPLGAFEIDPFGDGTFALAREAASMTKAGTLMSVAGGGDTVAALNAAGVTGDFSYVSSAGGAFLEWLEGRELPGVAALAAAGLRQV